MLMTNSGKSAGEVKKDHGGRAFADSDELRTANEGAYAMAASILKSSVPDSDEWHSASIRLMGLERSIAEIYGFDEVDRLHREYLGGYDPSRQSRPSGNGAQAHNSNDEEDWEL